MDAIDEMNSDSDTTVAGAPVIEMGDQDEEDDSPKFGTPKLRRGRTKGVASRMKKVKKGHLVCKGCNKELPFSQFHDGQAMCKNDMKALRNIKNQCKTQADKDFFEAQKGNDKSLRRMLTTYHVRCHLGAGKRNKRLVFSLMEYKEETIQEEAVDQVGEYEMMTILQAEEWFGLKKNGSMGVDAARVEWKRLHDATDSVTDLLGPTPELAHRVAIKTRDMILHRNSDLKRKSYSLIDQKKNKSITQDLIDKTHERMLKSHELEVACEVDSAVGKARELVRRTQVGSNEEFSLGGGIGSDVGATAAFVYDVRQLVDQPEEGRRKMKVEDSDGEDKSQPSDAEDAGSKKSTPKKGRANAKAKAKVDSNEWGKRHEILMLEIKNVSLWQTENRINLLQACSKLEEARNSVPAELLPKVQGEINLLETRLRSMKLVLGVIDEKLLLLCRTH